MMSAALNLGISLDRWQNCTTTMIEKQPGNPKINKLRVIHLYEADYNAILKIVWARKVVWHAHDNDTLNNGQAGSRPGRNAIDVVIQKDMKYLNSRLTKTNIATMDNDAKSCYDRILCNLAMIISQYFGISNTSAAVQATTLKLMKFRLRTATGNSNKTYQHSDETPIHGTGQGSCASPSIWLMISSILMDCLAEIGGDMTMTDMIDEKIIQQWIDGFVDDTSLFSNINPGTVDDTISNLQKKLKHDMMKWKELLEASGGKLELSKCFYYILSWKYDDEGNAMPMSIDEQRRECEQITINDNDDELEVRIDQKEVNVAHKTLGCYKAIDGNEVEQIKYLKSKSDKYGYMLKNAKLSRKQANMAFKSIYIPSIKYGLPACSISKNDIAHIQNYTMDKFLPYMGYEHGTARALIHGPTEMGGANVPHLFTEMMGMKLESFISHIRADTVLGESMKININYLQLISGRELPLFESNDNIDYIPENWLTHLRNYLIEINGQIKIKGIWKAKKLRDNDINLMDKFLTLQFTTPEIRLINNWRVFFKVMYLSEICSPDGLKIQSCFFKRPLGNKINATHQSALRWPNQPEPGKKGFSLWIKCLRTCFNTTSCGRINHNFGNWISSDQLRTTTKCKIYYQSSTSLIFRIHEDSITSSFPSKVMSSSAHLSNSSSVNNLHHDILPSDCIPAEIISESNVRKKATFSKQYKKANQQFGNEVEEWQHSFIKNLNTLDESIIKKSLNNSNQSFYIISDGGVFQYDGTFGVIISDGINPIANNHGKLYSVEFFESSYLSELYGMLAGILCFNKLRQVYQDSTSSLKRNLFLYSDNKTLIKKITSRRKLRRTVNQHRDSDVDLELQLLYEINKLEDEFNIIINQVRGHQELKKLRSELSHAELMNVLADDLSRKARKLKQEPMYTTLPQNNLDLILNGDVINSKYSIRTKVAYHSIPLRKYYQKKYKWSDKTIENIWWKSYFNSLANYNTTDRTKIFKFINDRWATKARDHKYYKFRPKFCGHCQGQLENEDHIIRCLSKRREEIRAEWLQEVETFLLNENTPILVKHAIYDNLELWLEPSTISTNEYIYPSNILKALNHQQDIGWDQFIRGRISIEWGHIINEFMSTSDKKDFKAETWGANLLSINWKYIIKIWAVRCDDIHGRTNNEANIINKQKMIEEIAYIQEMNRELLLQDIEWLHEDIEIIKTYDNIAVESWLYGAKLVAKINQRKLKDREKHNRSKGKTTNIFGGKSKDRRDLDPGEMPLDT